MHAQNGALGRVDDRGGHQGAEHTTVGDGEVAASQLIHGQFAVAALAGQILDGLLDVGQAHVVAVAQHRGHQTTGGGDGDADVEVVVVDDVVTIQPGVHFRIALEGLHYRLHVEGHEAELDAVLLLEDLAVLLAQIHDGLHVDLVEGGQHGGGVFRFQQTLGDALAQTGHRHPLLAATGQRGNRRDRRSSHRSGCGRLAQRLDVGFHIILGDATALAGAGQLGHVDVVLANQTTHGGAQAIGAIIGNRFGRLLLGLFTGHGSRLDGGDQLAGEDGCPLCLQDVAQHASLRCRHFQHHLVGFDVDQHFITGNQITRLLVPGGNGGIRH